MRWETEELAAMLRRREEEWERLLAVGNVIPSFLVEWVRRCRKMRCVGF